MADPQSALAGCYHIGPIGVRGARAPVTLCERTGRSLLQVCSWPGEIDRAWEAVAALTGMAQAPGTARAATAGDASAFLVAPERLWLSLSTHSPERHALTERLSGCGAMVTDIDHARTVLRTAGERAGELLNRGLPVDLDERAFAPGTVAQSALHQIHVLVHRAERPGAPAFDLYVPREYAAYCWEWLVWASESIGGTVAEPQP